MYTWNKGSTCWRQEGMGLQRGVMKIVVVVAVILIEKR
jgi:hypothetical protein